MDNYNGIEIFYSGRYAGYNKWIISNTTYSLFSVNVTNANNSLPGIGHEAYGHYNHDNPFDQYNKLVTLTFTFINTVPSNTPTETPTYSLSPTLTPIPAPTQSPTPICKEIRLILVSDGDCNHGITSELLVCIGVFR